MYRTNTSSHANKCLAYRFESWNFVSTKCSQKPVCKNCVCLRHINFTFFAPNAIMVCIGRDIINVKKQSPAFRYFFFLTTDTFFRMCASGAWSWLVKFHTRRYTLSEQKVKRCRHNFCANLSCAVYANLFFYFFQGISSAAFGILCCLSPSSSPHC